MDDKKRVTFSKIYLIIMSAVCTCLALLSFLFGFEPKAHRINFYTFIFPLVSAVIASVIYDIVILILYIIGKRVRQKRLALYFPIILAILIYAAPSIIDFGEDAAIAYAGKDNLMRDSDKLMAKASQNILGHRLTVLPENEYPASFKRLGAYCVEYNNSNVYLIRDGWISKKYGVSVSGEGKGTDRVKKFEWN